MKGQISVTTACDVIGIPTPRYCGYRRRYDVIDVERLTLRAHVTAIFNQFNNVPGSRTIATKLQEGGINISRFKVMRLMEEANLGCGQPGPHNYKVATQERPDIPNRLDREFTVTVPNQVWSGDIGFIFPPICGGQYRIKQSMSRRGNCWDTQSTMLENIMLI